MSQGEELKMAVGAILGAIIGFYLWPPLVIVVPIVLLAIWFQRRSSR